MNEHLTKILDVVGKYQHEIKIEQGYIFVDVYSFPEVSMDKLRMVLARHGYLIHQFEHSPNLWNLFIRVDKK